MSLSIRYAATLVYVLLGTNIVHSFILSMRERCWRQLRSAAFLSMTQRFPSVSSTHLAIASSCWHSHVDSKHSNTIAFILQVGRSVSATTRSGPIALTTPVDWRKAEKAKQSSGVGLQRKFLYFWDNGNPVVTSCNTVYVRMASVPKSSCIFSAVLTQITSVSERHTRMQCVAL